MKKAVVFLMAALMLAGCSAQETFETVADELAEQVSAEILEIQIELPAEAASPASESEYGRLYQCDGYEIMLQTLSAGDLDATIRAVSGYGREDLTVMETRQGDWKRYELVWASAGETGDRVGKAVILDDGSWHYVVSVLADADRAGEYEEVWRKMFDSVTVN